MVTSTDAVLGPGLQASLQAQACSALSTPRSPAPGEPPAAKWQHRGEDRGEDRGGQKWSLPGSCHRSTSTSPEGRRQLSFVRLGTLWP